MQQSNNLIMKYPSTYLDSNNIPRQRHIKKAYQTFQSIDSNIPRISIKGEDSSKVTLTSENLNLYTNISSTQNYKIIYTIYYRDAPDFRCPKDTKEYNATTINSKLELEDTGISLSLIIESSTSLNITVYKLDYYEIAIERILFFPQDTSAVSLKFNKIYPVEVTKTQESLSLSSSTQSCQGCKQLAYTGTGLLAAVADTALETEEQGMFYSNDEGQSWTQLLSGASTTCHIASDYTIASNQGYLKYCKTGDLPYGEKYWGTSKLNLGSFDSMTYSYDAKTYIVASSNHSEGLYYCTPTYPYPPYTWTKCTLPESSGFYKVIYSKDKQIWVAIANGNGLYYSTDGITWTQSNITSCNGNTKNLYYAQGLFVSTGGQDTISIETSTDGKTWTKRQTVNSKIQCIYYNHGIWLAGTYSDGLYASKNGITWKKVLSTTSPIHTLICYDRVFVAGSFDANCYTSTDPYNSWIEESNTSWRVNHGSLCTSNLLMLYGQSGILCKRTHTGVKKININNIEHDDIYCAKPAYNKGLYILPPINENDNYIHTSPDLKNWSDTYVDSLHGGNSCTALVCNGKTFVSAMGMVVSTDNKIWTKCVLESGQTTGALDKICYGNGIYVGAGKNYVSGILYSYDGITWSKALTSIYVSDIIYYNKLFIAVVLEHESSVYTLKLLYSSDGITWDVGLNGGEFNSRNFGPRICIFKNKLILYKYTSTDGKTWETFSDTPLAYCATDGNICVATKFDTSGIYTSTDGVNWNKLSTPFAVYSGGTLILCKDNTWIVCTDNTIQISYDLLSWRTYKLIITLGEDIITATNSIVLIGTSTGLMCIDSPIYLLEKGNQIKEVKK